MVEIQNTKINTFVFMHVPKNHDIFMILIYINIILACLIACTNEGNFIITKPPYLIPSYLIIALETFETYATLLSSFLLLHETRIRFRLESLGTCARVINEQLLQDCSKRAPPLTPPRVTTQSMASTLDLDRARAALMVAAGVTTAAAIVLSQRSILSIMANALKVGSFQLHMWLLTPLH